MRDGQTRWVVQLRRIFGPALLCLVLAPADARRASELELTTSLQGATTQGAPVAGRSIRAAPSAYRLDSGDGLTVTVFGEPDLSVKGVRVTPDGKIAMPLIGELVVRGRTSRDIERLIEGRLLDGYLKNPSVTVSIDTYRLYYIKGEVKAPGGYSYIEGLTLEKAVAIAGGYTERASESKISLVREAAPEGPVDTVAPSTPIMPGDVITIGESFF